MSLFGPPVRSFENDGKVIETGRELVRELARQTHSGMLVLESDVRPGGESVEFKFRLPKLGKSQISLRYLMFGHGDELGRFSLAFGAEPSMHLVGSADNFLMKPVSTIARDTVAGIRAQLFTRSYADPGRIEYERIEAVLGRVSLSLPGGCYVYSSSRLHLLLCGFDAIDIEESHDLHIPGLAAGWYVMHDNEGYYPASNAEWEERERSKKILVTEAFNTGVQGTSKPFPEEEPDDILPPKKVTFGVVRVGRQKIVTLKGSTRFNPGSAYPKSLAKDLNGLIAQSEEYNIPSMFSVSQSGSIISIESKAWSGVYTVSVQFEAGLAEMLGMDSGRGFASLKGDMHEDLSVDLNSEDKKSKAFENFDEEKYPLTIVSDVGAVNCFHSVRGLCHTSGVLLDKTTKSVQLSQPISLRGYNGEQTIRLRFAGNDGSHVVFPNSTRVRAWIACT